jgi:hypothetical protein
MSFTEVNDVHRVQQRWAPNLLQRLVVDEMGGVLGDFKLPLLDLLAELPVRGARGVNMAQGDRLQTLLQTPGSHGEA